MSAQTFYNSINQKIFPSKTKYLIKNLPLFKDMLMFLQQAFFRHFIFCVFFVIHSSLSLSLSLPPKFVPNPRISSSKICQISLSQP